VDYGLFNQQFLLDDGKGHGVFVDQAGGDFG
jgi:hypothetical protein